jgi:hypothetical protein
MPLAYACNLAAKGIIRGVLYSATAAIEPTRASAKSAITSVSARYQLLVVVIAKLAVGIVLDRYSVVNDLFAARATTIT